MPGHEALEYQIEEGWRQEAVVVAITACDFSKIVAGPGEFVSLPYNNSRAVVVESEMALDRSRNFDRGCWISGRAVRDRQDECTFRCLIRLPFDRKYDDARAILAPLILPRLPLEVP